jgi:hypothetical protein
MADPKTTRQLKWVARLVLGLVVGFLMLRWFEHRQVFHPDARMEATGRELGRPFEDVYFCASDGVKLNGWFYPAETSSPRAHFVFLLCHGNAGNISHRLDHASALLETGASVFLLDYRGYGRSEGRPGEGGTYLDAQAAYAWLRGRGFAATNLLTLGESLGGAVATELALRERLGGLVLLSTFTSVPDLGAELFPWLPVRWLGWIRYDTVNKLPHVRVPVAVLHSRADTLVGFPHAERNFAAANEPRLLWEIAGDHNDFLFVDRPRYVAGVNEFLRRLELAGPEPGQATSGERRPVPPNPGGIRR